MAELITAVERRPRAGDWYLVAALGIGSAVFAVLYDAGGFWPFAQPLWVACAASVLVAVPLAVRRRMPSLVAWMISAIYITALFLGAIEPAVSQVALFMGVYSIGAWQSNRRFALLSRLLLCTAMFISLIIVTITQLDDLGELSVLQYTANVGISFLINIAFFGGAWVFGDRAWRQRQLSAELREAGEEVRRQEQQLADQALDLERVRIARELHDGVAHHIAGVGIHAAAARRSLEKNPDRARESLRTIESSARETVEELRSLVHTLRETSSPNAPTEESPRNPGLADLPELCERARGRGLRVTVATLGTPRPLTPMTELSVYRVIQESLTNCGRYAGADAEVDVRLRYGASELEVEVSDSRPTAAPVPGRGSSRDPSGQPKGTGLGIVGMRERMTALGGTLEAGPKSRGGWLVRARIPVTRSAGETQSPAAAHPVPDAAWARIR